MKTFFKHFCINITAKNLEKCSLKGHFIDLVPLSIDHVDKLWDALQYSEVWKFKPNPKMNKVDFRKDIEHALELESKGEVQAFTTLEKANNTIVGTTRFGNIDKINKRAEIGWTSVTPKYQKTPVNTEAKYLMLNFSFENLGFNRVEFKTDKINTKSREAILRLGAKEEGILRKHVICTDGRVRDTVYYSIIDQEWPEIKLNLQKKLEKYKIFPNI